METKTPSPEGQARRIRHAQQAAMLAERQMQRAEIAIKEAGQDATVIIEIREKLGKLRTDLGGSLTAVGASVTTRAQQRVEQLRARLLAAEAKIGPAPNAKVRKPKINSVTA